MTLVLSGMCDHRKYLLDSDSGVWTKTSEILPDSGAPGFSGFADVRRVGLLIRHALFVAVYVKDGRLWMRLGDDKFDLDTPEMRISRLAVRPLVESFEVWDGDVLLRQYRYWWVESHDWPPDDVVDIFLYIPTNLGTPENRRRIAALWTLMHRGTPATEAASTVERAGRQ